MKYIGTSWKMNNTPGEALLYVEKYMSGFPSLDLSRIKPFLIPPFVSISLVRKALPTSVLVGAQNMHWADCGAFTGEISAAMLKDLDVDIVEIGHSERRRFFNETDHTVGLKAKQALLYGMSPLVCIGESVEIKEAGDTIELLHTQIKGALSELSVAEALGIERNSAKIMFAYEPVWAIGEKGTPASPDYVQNVHSRIRRLLLGLLGEEGKHIPILYGGSVNASNAVDFLSIDDCDGLFVGRAAWEAAGFLEILALGGKVL